MPFLIMRVYVHPDTVDKDENPFNLATYFIDSNADDPVPILDSARWELTCGHERVPGGNCLDCDHIAAERRRARSSGVGGTPNVGGICIGCEPQ